MVVEVALEAVGLAVAGAVGSVVGGGGLVDEVAAEAVGLAVVGGLAKAVLELGLVELTEAVEE